ncbi:MAG: hypothetical protein AB1758_24230, partial [Candidatus Eremiobacterota bacterium]
MRLATRLILSVGGVSAGVVALVVLLQYSTMERAVVGDIQAYASYVTRYHAARIDERLRHYVELSEDFARLGSSLSRPENA